MDEEGHQNDGHLLNGPTPQAQHIITFSPVIEERMSSIDIPPTSKTPSPSNSPDVSPHTQRQQRLRRQSAFRKPRSSDSWSDSSEEPSGTPERVPTPLPGDPRGRRDSRATPSTPLAFWRPDDILASVRKKTGGRTGSELLSMLDDEKDSDEVLQNAEARDAAMLMASWWSDEDLVRRLLDSGASPDAHDALGRTALHLASGVGSVPCVEVLLGAGAQINVWDTNGVATPLHCAASAGSIHCVSILLGAGALVDAGLEDKGHTALLCAVQVGGVDVARILLAHGARCDSTLVYSETPLHAAAARGDARCLQLLLGAGANVRNQFGPRKLTALHLAAEDGGSEAVQVLLDHGAQPNATDAQGKTPLHLAAKAQAVEVVNHLLRAGAKVDARDDNQRTSLHCAVGRSRGTEVARALLDCGADARAQDSFGHAPLHVAALHEAAAAAALLLHRGGDLTARTAGGHSALSLLVRRTPEALDAFVRMLDHGVTVHEHDVSDANCELKLDFRILVPNSNRGETELLLLLLEEGQRTLLKHPLIEAFLHHKWQRVRKFFWISLLFQTTLVLLYTGYVLAIYLYVCKAQPDVTPLPSSPSPALPSSTVTPESTSLCHLSHLAFANWVALLIFTATMIIKELFQMRHNWRRYFRNWENWLQWIIIISVLLVALHPRKSNGIFLSNQEVDNPEDILVMDWQRPLAAIGLFMAWAQLMLVVGRFPAVGTYVQMLTKVARNLGGFLMAYFCLLVAFSLAFCVLLPNYPPFKQGVLASFLKTLVMMTGELEFENLFYDSEVQYPGLSHVFFMGFVLLGAVVLMNLLVGLAVSDIQGLRRSAGLDRLQRQAQLTAHLEALLFSSVLKHVLPLRAHRALQRAALLSPNAYRWVLHVRPNDPRDHRLPRELSSNALRLVSECPRRSRKGGGPSVTTTSISTADSHRQSSRLYASVASRFSTSDTTDEEGISQQILVAVQHLQTRIGLLGAEQDARDATLHALRKRADAADGNLQALRRHLLGVEVALAQLRSMAESHWQPRPPPPPPPLPPPPPVFMSPLSTH